MMITLLPPDCILSIITFLSLADENNLGRTCRQMAALCLRETSFKRYVKRKYSVINYEKVYKNLKSWKKTAHHLWLTVYPIQVLVFDIFDQFFHRFAMQLNPWRLCPFCVYVECNHLKRIYQKCYPGIIEASSQDEAYYNAFVPANESFTCKCQNDCLEVRMKPAYEFRDTMQDVIFMGPKPFGSQYVFFTGQWEQLKGFLVKATMMEMKVPYSHSSTRNVLWDFVLKL